MNENLRITWLPIDFDASHAGIVKYDYTDLEIAEEITHAVGSNDFM